MEIGETEGKQEAQEIKLLSSEQLFIKSEKLRSLFNGSIFSSSGRAREKSSWLSN